MSDVNVTDPNAGGTPATPSPAPAPVAATPATPAAPVASATPNATPQAPATDGAPGAGWVPSHRIRETREAAIREANAQFQAREQAYQNELRQVQQQLRALVGVAPPANPENDAIKQQFAALFPSLAKLEAKGVDIEKLLERAGDFEQATTHHWQSYGRQSVERLETLVGQAIGSPLNDDQKQHLQNAFVAYVQSSPENTDRYTKDPSIVDDFAKAFTSSFIEPVRRSAVAAPIPRTQVPLPQDSPGGVPRATPAPTPQSMDERASLAWIQYQQSQQK